MAALILHDVPFEVVPTEVRLLTCRTPAGFPSPAQDDMEEPIDLGIVADRSPGRELRHAGVRAFDGGSRGG